MLTLKPFKDCRDELTVTSNGVILRGHRIVIPSLLQTRAIQLAHGSRQG